MNAIESRRSIRRYLDTPVNDDLITSVIHAGILAPSAKNGQPWRFIVYRGANKDALLSAMGEGLTREHRDPRLPASAAGLPDAYNTLRIMRTAPVVIIVMNPDGADPFMPIDTEGRIGEICNTLSIGACIENILLAAAEKGLGTLWIANTCFAYPELNRFVGEPGQLVCAIAVGHPAEDPPARPRKPLNDVIEFR